MWISLLILARVAVPAAIPTCALPDWQVIRERREQAYAAGNFDRALELAECEHQALLAAPGWLHDAGVPVHRCEPLEVIFDICNERTSGPECAGAALDRYTLTGCDQLPRFAGEYHRLRAQYHQRRMEYGEAIDALDTADELSAICWTDDAESATYAENADDTLLELAIVASQRTQLATELRAWTVARTNAALAVDLIARAGPARTGAIADILNLLAWSMLLARETGGDVGDPGPLLTRALTGFVQSSSTGASNVRINLGLTALQNESLDDVERALAGVVLADLSAEERLWLRLVQIRTALATGDTTRVEIWLRDVDALAASEATPMGRWVAAWCRGLVHENDDHQDLAIAAYATAEAELERLAHGPLATEDNRTSERAYLLFADATRRLVRARLGDPTTAARTAREARTRAARVTARASCPAAQRARAAPPAPGELRLLYFPASPQAPTGRSPEPPLWVGFAMTSDAVRAVLLKMPPSPDDWQVATQAQLAEWSAAILEPFRPEIDRAAEIVALPVGRLHAVPIHALPWGADLLLSTTPMRYGLDIETCGSPDLEDRPLTAQILRDPGIDFSRESHAVADALTSGGYAVETLTPRTPADLAPLLEDPATIVHVAAHGQQLVDGLLLSDDRLVFANDLTLTRPQILAARSAPAVVLLSSCRSSFADAEALGGGLSLAQAFMLRGTRFVAGADGDVDGELATSFATHFHRELAARPLYETPIAWQQAYLKTRAALHSREQPGMRMLRLFGP